MFIFFYGEDTFRANRKIQELKKRFLTQIGGGEDSISFLDGSEADLSEIKEKISASSLFSSGNKRMIVLKNTFQNPQLSELSEYFRTQKEETDNTVIFWEPRIKSKRKGAKTEILMIDSVGREKPLSKKARAWFEFLNSQKFSQEFFLLSNTELNKWVREEFKSRGGEISTKACELLISLVGNNLWQLNQEINKLIYYKKGQGADAGQTVEPEEVEELVEGLFDQDIFALTDAISNQNYSLAVNLLEKQYSAGVNEYYLLNMITRQIKILLQIRQCLDEGESSRKMISSLGLHPFVVQKGINQARKFSLIKLKRSLNSLVEMDYLWKSGQSDSRVDLDLFLLRV